MNSKRFKLKKYFRLFAEYNCWNLEFWYVDWDFSFVAIFDWFRISWWSFRAFYEIYFEWYKETESCQKHFFESKHRITVSRIDMSMKRKNDDENFANFWTRIKLNFRWYFRWDSRIHVMIINCCVTIANSIWFEIFNRNSYEINCTSISVEKCKSWWL